MGVFVFTAGLLVLMADHPMVVVGGLLGLSILLSFVLYDVMSVYWFSCVLLLVMLSGVLVVFTYMSSLSPNEGLYLDAVGMVIGLSVGVMGGIGLVGVVDDMSDYVGFMWVSLEGVLGLWMLSLLLGVMVVVVWVGGMESGPVRVGCASGGS